MITGIIKFKYIVIDVRFNSGYFLNEDAVNSRYLEENRDKCATLDEFASIWNPPIFKRQFCQKTEKSIPYCQSSDVANAFEGSDIYINRIQATKVGSVVEVNQILVTGFGTIGNTRLINELSSGISYANNCCRIKANGDKLFGYLYAVLTSKYGRSQLNKNASGSVVRYIEAPGIKRTLIPNLLENKLHEIHNLIVKASNMRIEANKLLTEADQIFHSLNEINYQQYHLCVSENEKYNGFKFRINEKARISIKAKNHSKRILEIRDLWESIPGKKLSDYVTQEFRIGVRGTFKRIDSNVIGTEMISQGDLHRINPKNFKRVIISRRSDGDFAKDNQVLFPAVGNGSNEGEILFRPTLAYKSFTNKLLSGDIGRLECPTLEHAAYLLVALKSKGGFRMMRAFYYGTQLRRPLWELLKEINIPLKNEKVFSEVSGLVIKAYNLRYLADEKEDKAILLLEKEIESWQK